MALPAGTNTSIDMIQVYAGSAKCQLKMCGRPAESDDAMIQTGYRELPILSELNILQFFMTADTLS